MLLHASTSTVGHVPVVTLTGPVDLSGVGVLRDVLVRVVAEHPGRRIVVDLDGVDALDDVGLGLLLGAAGRAREAGGDLVVVSSRAAVRERLVRTGFDRAVDLVGGLAELLA